VETTRDLGQIELWQASLERSLARRGKLARSSVELYRLQPERDLAAPDLFLESTAYWQARRRAQAARPAIPRPVVGLGGVSALALLTVTTLPTLFGGRARRGGQQVAFTAQAVQPSILGNGQRHSLSTVTGAAAPTRPAPAPKPAVTTQSKPTAETVAQQQTTVAKATRAAHAAPAHAARLHTTPAPKPTTTASKPATADHVASATKPTVTAPKPAAPKPTTTHKAAPKPATVHKPAPKPTTHKRAHKPSRPTSGYVNPLAHASVTPERIDQGVDYAGTGTLTAIGEARITYVGITGTGWPGAFIEYQLLNGPDAGRYVYYAEGVRPTSGISVGRTVGAGQPVATLIPGWSTGIEIGWGAGIGTETYAAAHGEHSYPTPAGESFSALIASLGGPPGR
jgi:cell division septation protein DedD